MCRDTDVVSYFRYYVSETLGVLHGINKSTHSWLVGNPFVLSGAGCWFKPGGQHLQCSCFSVSCMGDRGGGGVTPQAECEVLGMLVKIVTDASRTLLWSIT